MSFESIHNYYEKLVLAALQAGPDNLVSTDDDYLSDIACVALNQLPARYVRHDVDMIFYMTPDERARMDEEVAQAVRTAVEYVNQHRDTDRPRTISV